MAVKLQIEIQGEILQVRDNYSTTAWSQVYPSQDFHSRGLSFNYDALRGMGNGTHIVKANGLPEKVKRDSGGRYGRG